MTLRTEMSVWHPVEPPKPERIGGGFYSGLLLALFVGMPLWLGIWWGATRFATWVLSWLAA